MPIGMWPTEDDGMRSVCSRVKRCVLPRATTNILPWPIPRPRRRALRSRTSSARPDAISRSIATTAPGGQRRLEGTARSAGPAFASELVLAIVGAVTIALAARTLGEIERCLRPIEMSRDVAGERPGSMGARRARLRGGHRRARTEITASRLLAPYFGSSTIVWANLIGIVLAALALGYWLGGRLADRRPEPPLLGYIVLVSAMGVAVITFAAKPFLDFTVEGLDTASAGAVIGSFLAVLLLCAPPVVLLGMVSPFAIRLAVASIATAGAVAGRLYALSTAGSLLGTFLPALVLIPAIGTQRTFLVICRRARGVLLLSARGPLSRRGGDPRGSARRAAGAIKAEEGLITRTFVSPVHRRRRASDGGGCCISTRASRLALGSGGRTPC